MVVPLESQTTGPQINNQPLAERTQPKQIEHKNDHLWNSYWTYWEAPPPKKKGEFDAIWIQILEHLVIRDTFANSHLGRIGNPKKAYQSNFNVKNLRNLGFLGSLTVTKNPSSVSSKASIGLQE